MYLGNMIEYTDGENALEHSGTFVLEKDIASFEKECKKEGCTVYFFGTYELGDFDTFTKIITSLTVTKEQREIFDNDDDEIAYYEKFAQLIKSNDEELLEVNFDVVINRG